MKNIYNILLFLALLSCNKADTIEKRIYADLKDNTSTVQVDLKKYTSFDWDTVYIFQISVPLETVNQVIGIGYKNYVEFTRPIIFTKNGKIVYSENNKANIEGLEEGQFVYKDLLSTEQFVVRNNTNRIFSMKIMKNGDVNFIMIE